MGLRPLHPQIFPHPRLLRICQSFEPHSVAGLQELAISPNFGFVGDTPLLLVMGALLPVSPVFSHPRLLGFESHSVTGFTGVSY